MAWYTYTYSEMKLWYKLYMEYYSSLKKKDILPFATRWMNVEAIMPTEISQTQKDTKCMIRPSLHMESKKVISYLNSEIVWRGLNTIDWLVEHFYLLLLDL